MNIWTGTVGKYIGNYYFLWRGNVIPDEYGTSLSMSLQTRRYFGDENYLAVAVAGGKSLNYRDSTEEVVTLASKRITLDVYHDITRLWYGSAGVGYEYEEIRPDVFRDHWTTSVGVEKRF